MSRKSEKLPTWPKRVEHPFQEIHEKEIDRLERLHNVLREDPLDSQLILNQKRDFKKIFGI